jgi:hypothetical protein
MGDRRGAYIVWMGRPEENREPRRPRRRERILKWALMTCGE